MGVEREYQPLKKWKLGVLGLAGLPFVVKFAYLNAAWVSSPVDRAGLGLWGCGVLLIVVLTAILKLIFRFQTNKPLAKSRALRVLPLPIALYALGIIFDLNAVQLIASVGIAWMTAWMLYGRIVGSLLAVAAVMAVLAVPGSSYWLGKASSSFIAPLREAYAPEFGARSQKGYLGHEIPPDESFSRFFRTSEAHQYRYASMKDEISVLSVRVGADIHEIHPATHCLRSSGWTVESERIREVALAGRTEPLSVTEAIVSTGAGDRMLVWIWYSSEQESTGSFIRFRRMYSSGATWRTYQVSVMLESDEKAEEARWKLIAFLASGEVAR